MNFRNEPYPPNIDEFITKSHLLANELSKKLNNKDCKKLCDFYSEVNKKVMCNYSLFKELEYCKSNEEPKGLYVFGENQSGVVIPVYVGISRSLYKRLKDHGWGKTHNTATLAHLIAKDLYPKNKWTFSSIRRESIQSHYDIEKAKKDIQNFNIVIYPVKNDYELYLYEVLLSGIWKTKWNSFRTH